MKLAFFSFALLFGFALIHAQVPASDDKPPAPQNPPQPATEGKKPTESAPELSPHNTQTESQKGKVDSKPEENVQVPSVPLQPESEKPTSASTTPSSTTQPPTKPTTQPPPPAPTGPGSWSIIDPKTNAPCIMVSGTISMNATLRNYQGGVNATKIVAFGPKTPVNGSCSEELIRWNKDADNSLQFKFFVNKTSHEVYLIQVDGAALFPELKVNNTVGFRNASMHAFETPSNKSFYCSTSMELPVFDHGGKIFTVKLEDFQIQAGKISKDKNFDEKIDACPAGGNRPDIIPIVVGCALAILVVIVLVAYLINRRRSQAHGYLSM